MYKFVAQIIFLNSSGQLELLIKKLQIINYKFFDKTDYQLSIINYQLSIIKVGYNNKIHYRAISV